MPHDNNKEKKKKPLAGEAIALSKMSDSDLQQVAKTSSDQGQVDAAKAEVERRKKKPKGRAAQIVGRNMPNE